MTSFLNAFSYLILALCAALIAVGCEGQVAEYEQAGRLETLHVLPSSAFNNFIAGDTDETYVSSSADPFQDGAYVVKDKQVLDLSVYNTSTLDDTRVDLEGDRPILNKDTNTISKLVVVVTARGLEYLWFMALSGRVLYPEDFSYGTPRLPDGELLEGSGRFPGYYAILEFEELPSETEYQLTAALAATAGFSVHFGVYGQAWGERLFLSGARSGTSILFPEPLIPDPMFPDTNGEIETEIAP